MTAKPKKTWVETERQGRGRRYWFRTDAEAAVFARERADAGYQVASGYTTVWVSFGRRPTDDSRAQQAGRGVEP